jgi:uncharacterized membrane protein SirB2
MCDCITELQNRNNTDQEKMVLDTVLLFTGRVLPKLGAYVAIKKKDGTWGKDKLVCVFPTYCPWCGKEYEKRW